METEEEQPTGTRLDVDERGWAYATPLIEQGSLLLSAPSNHFSINQQYFHKTVIFIVEHTSSFTRGVILNRPTAFNTGDLVEEAMVPVPLEFILNRSDTWNVWCGGDCQGLNTKGDGPEQQVSYCCLHTLERLGSMSMEIIKGAYLIDLAKARGLVAQGDADKDDFLLLVGYCGWAPGQLQGELDRGDTWTLAAADQRVLLGRLRDAQAALTRRLEAAASQPGGDRGHISAAEVGDGIEEWAELYAALGPKFVAELERDRGDPLSQHTDEMLRRWINRCLIPPRLLAPVAKGLLEGDPEPLELPAGTILRGSATAWILGKPAERPGMETKLPIPGQFLHKSVLYLVKDYSPNDTEAVLLVLLNGPRVGEVQGDSEGDTGGIYFGGPTAFGPRDVYELKGDIKFRFQGMIALKHQTLEELINLGALDVADEMDLGEVLASPSSSRWEAAGGRIDRLSEAAEARLGDVQRRLWYKRFLDIDLGDAD